MASKKTDSLDTTRQLEWERRVRPRAAVAAFIGAILTIGSALAGGLAFTGRPAASVLDALARAELPGSVSHLASLQVSSFQFFDQRALLLVLVGIAQALAFVAVAGALYVLARATAARSEQFPVYATKMVVVGAGLSAISAVFLNVSFVVSIHNFLHGSRDVAAAMNIAGGGVSAAGQLVGAIGAAALGLGFVLTCLHAMRSGLLTRFMGVLGIAVGALVFVSVVLPLASQQQLLQTIWFLMLGYLFLGRWRGPVLPAWASGKAEPWPSAPRAQRGAPRAPRRAADPEMDPVGEVLVSNGSGGHPSSKKKKRKRRS